MHDLVWHSNAWEDYLYWQQQDKKTMQRINDLIKDTLRSPFKGIGKPESLKGDLSGCWSRRRCKTAQLLSAFDSPGLLYKIKSP